MKPSGPILLEAMPEEIEKKATKVQPAAKKKQPLPLLPLVTYEPVGNPLAKMNDAQKQFFLDSLLRAARPMPSMQSIQSMPSMQQSAALARASAEQSRFALSTVQRQSAIQIGQAMAESRSKEASKKEAKETQLKETRSKAAIASSQERALSESAEKRRQSQPSQLPSFSSSGTGFKEAKDSLAFVLADYARGDEKKLRGAMDEFNSRLSSAQHKSADLMATLLLVIEDKAWDAGEEGAAGSAKHFGARIGRGTEVPEILRESARDSAVVRLASVREMLRHYFEAHPKEYASILAAALGLTSDQEADSTFMQERLASELAHIGGFAFAQKMLAELKLRKKLDKDNEKCLLQLGYRYDRKRRVLVLGKRTCGTPAEARGIIALLLSAARKGKDF
ncbi:MAG: hypothetical protein WCT52_05410 [Candidatus Micrarchaeia archaeon]